MLSCSRKNFMTVQNLNESFCNGINKDRIKFKRTMKLLSTWLGKRCEFSFEFFNVNLSHTFEMSDKESTFKEKRC